MSNKISIGEILALPALAAGFYALWIATPADAAEIGPTPSSGIEIAIGVGLFLLCFGYPVYRMMTDSRKPISYDELRDYEPRDDTDYPKREIPKEANAQ